MQRKVVLTQVAEKQLDNTIEYIETNFGEQTKVKFINKLEEVVKIIQDNPFAFPISKYNKKIRRCVLSKQTTIYYHTNNEKVTILTIFDSRQDSRNILKYIDISKA